MSQVDQRLQERGVVIPSAASPVGNYVGYTVSGKFVFVSGQLPLADGVVAIKGRLGDDLDIDAGYKAARLCGLNHPGAAQRGRGRSILIAYHVS